MPGAREWWFPFVEFTSFSFLYVSTTLVHHIPLCVQVRMCICVSYSYVCAGTFEGQRLTLPSVPQTPSTLVFEGTGIRSFIVLELTD